MGTPPEGYAVGWQSLRRAAEAVGEAAREIKRPIDDFNTMARPERSDFAMVESGAQNLYESYAAFWRQVDTWAKDLHTSLATAEEGLSVASAIYRRGEDLSRSR